MATAAKENSLARARKVVIEKRKEDAERQAAAAEQREEQDRLMQERINAAAEEERRKQERWAASRLLNSSYTGWHDAISTWLLASRFLQEVAGLGESLLVQEWPKGTRGTEQFTDGLVKQRIGDAQMTLT